MRGSTAADRVDTDLMKISINCSLHMSDDDGSLASFMDFLGETLSL